MIITFHVACFYGLQFFLPSKAKQVSQSPSTHLKTITKLSTPNWELKPVLPITHSLKKKPRILQTFLDLVSPGSSCWGWLGCSGLMWTVSQENTARDLACLKYIAWCLAWLIFDIKFPFSSLRCRNDSFMVWRYLAFNSYVDFTHFETNFTWWIWLRPGCPEMYPGLQYLIASKKQKQHNVHQVISG